MNEEYTTAIWGVEDGEILDISDGILLESVNIDDDGIFPDSFDWLQFIAKVNDYGCTFLIENWLGVGYGTVEAIEGIYDQALYTFNGPIKVKTGYQIINGDRQDIISEVTKLIIEVNYEWSYSNVGKAKEIGVASMLDITGRVLEVS